MLLETLSYAAGLVPEIADDIVAVDQAMRLGYNWTYGPFELIDQLGADWLADGAGRGRAAGAALLRTAAGRTFYRVEDGRLKYWAWTAPTPTWRGRTACCTSDIKRASEPVAEERLGGAVGHRRRRACAWSSPAR